MTASVVQDGHVYGTGWHFGTGGNLEGAFKVAGRATGAPSSG